MTVDGAIIATTLKKMLRLIGTQILMGSEFLMDWLTLSELTAMEMTSTVSLG
jgi:hypothetical protein